MGSDAYRFGGQRLCYNTQLRTDRLEQAVWQEVGRLLEEPRLQAVQAPPAEASVAQLEKQIAKLRQGIARLIDG